MSKETKEAGKKPIKQQIIEHRWSIAALVAASVITAIYTALGYLKESSDFQAQAWFFGGWGITMLLVGANIGYIHADRRMLWAISDLVWISLTVFALGSALTPLESYFARQRLEIAIDNVHYAADDVVMFTYDAEREACRDLNEKLACKDWKGVADALRERPVLSTRLDVRMNTALAKVASQAPASVDLKKRLIALRNKVSNALETESRARKEATAINLWTPYLKILLLVCALGFRAGRTGAEIARNKFDAKRAAEKKLSQLAWSDV